MVFLLAIQAFVYASEAVDAVASAVTIVVGVALVVTGAYVAVAAGSLLAPAWGTAVAVPILGTVSAGTAAGTGLALIVGGDQWSRRDEIRKNYGAGSGNNGNNQTPSDPKNWQIEVKINDTGDKTKKTAVIQIKDTSTSTYITPPSGYNVYVSHSNSQINMTIGGASSLGVKAESIDTSSFVSIKDAPNLTVSGIPNIIKYALQKQSQLTRLEIVNSAGSVVYALSESMPNPSKPIPFVWNGKDVNGNNVVPGAYSVRIKAIKDDGSAEYSPISVMSVASAIPADNEQQITFDSENRAYVTFFNTSSSGATDVIYVKVKDSAGNILVNNSPGQAIAFDGSSGPTVAQNPMNFPTLFSIAADGLQYNIGIPSSSAPSEIISVEANDGQADHNITYEYNLDTNRVSIKSPAFSTKSYSESESDIFSGVLSMMILAGARAYKEVGLEYDSANSALIINQSTFLAKAGVGTGYSINVSNEAGDISITVSKGGELVTSVYNLNTNMVSLPSDFPWADKYDWNASAGSPITMASIPRVGASGVRASGVTDTFRDGAMKLIAISNKYLFYRRSLEARLYEAVKNNQKQPMARPVEPDITNITWYSRPAKTVTVEGAAGGVLPHIYVTNSSGVKEVSGASYSGVYGQLIFL